MHAGNHRVAKRAEGRSVVTIGKIVSTHGVRGALKVQSFSDVPRRFEDLKEVTLAGSTARRMLRVRSVAQMGRHYVLHLDGIETPEEAKSLLGLWLEIPQERLAPLPQGQYYTCDLLGIEVWSDEGALLGTVSDILPTKANDVFVVRGRAGQEHLIPGTKEIVRCVDVPGRRMTVRPVPGLLDEGTTNAL
jgi:16S rRNA processing protein RimM